MSTSRSDVGDSPWMQRHKAQTPLRRRLIEVDPVGVRDIDAAAACICACHPRPADRTAHGGLPCPCQRTPEEHRAIVEQARAKFDARGPAIEAANRARDEQIARIAADLGIEAVEDTPFAPRVIVGAVDGRAFYMRERSEHYSIVIAPDDDPTTNPWRQDGDPGITVRTGEATDLRPDDRFDYRATLTLITATIRTFLRRSDCPHPHTDGDWFCPRCGEALVDLNHPPADPPEPVDDAKAFIDSIDPADMRDGRYLRAVSRAREALIRADRTLIAAIRAAREAGDSWQMIATAMAVDTTFAQDFYERRDNRPSHGY